MKMWKRNAIVAAVVLLICGAVYVNWLYNQDSYAGKTLGEAALVGAAPQEKTQTPPSESGQSAQTPGTDGEALGQEGAAETGSGQESSGYFASARLNRQQARDSALSLLQNAAQEEGVSADTLQKANEAIQTMADCTMAEAQIENLITAKGYTDCVAFLNDNSISVVVSAMEDGLTDSDVARISEIVMEQTSLRGDQIKIIEAD